MNYINLKIFVVFLLIHLIDQVCCEANTLEDKYETGKEILLSVTIHHDNITSFYAKIDKEYDKLSNIFKDLNNKNIDGFIELSKNQIFMEVNNLAQQINKFSLDEQFKYEDFFRSNIEIYKLNKTLSNICFKNNNLLDKIMRCIDQHHDSKSTTNKTENVYYENIKNLLDAYNFLLIIKIKDFENKFVRATNKILSDAKNNNLEFIKRKPSINIPPTSLTKKDNSTVKPSFSQTHINDTLKNLYINQKNMLKTVNLLNWMVIQSMNSNMTLNHIDKMNHINHHEEKNVQCCFDHSKVELNKAKNIAVNDSNNCVEVERLNLENLVSLENKETEKHFSTCFHNNGRPEDIFGCMGWLQSSNYASKTLKSSYAETINKFNENQKFLYNKIYNCSYKSRYDFTQRLQYLNKQFDICVHYQKSSKECIEPIHS